MRLLTIVLLAFGLAQFPAPAEAAYKAKGKSYVKAKYAAKAQPRAFRKVSSQPVRVHEPDVDASGDPTVKSSAVLVIDKADGRLLFGKNTSAIQPIASITKLMTAMVVLDAKLDLNEPLEVNEHDIDVVKHTRSRLRFGTMLTRDDLLKLALMASENRAASALGRNYPGGINGFVAAMNQKARDIGMQQSRFVDSSGLSSENVSTAEDLAKMVTAAYGYPLIQHYTTLTEHVVPSASGRGMRFTNTNGLVKSGEWNITVSKTGYIQEAGRCLVMQAQIAAKPMIIVLLDSWGKQTRMGDANRIKKWIESRIMRPTTS